MNIRQQKYKKHLLEGKSKYESALLAGYAKTTALAHTAQLDKRIGIDKVMERNGLTDSFLIEKHKKLLEAVKVIGYLHQYKKSEKGGIEKISPEEAVSNEFIEVPDFHSIAKGLELAYKLKGYLKDRLEHSGKIEGGESKFIIINNGKSNEQQSLIAKIRNHSDAIPE